MGPTKTQEDDGRDQLGGTTLATSIVPEFGETEVAMHATRKDCWFIYKDVVYDVSGFVGDHPGGPDILMQYAGMDITDVFHSVMSHDHSDAAMSMLADHKIGVLKDPEFRLGKRTKEEQVMFVRDEEFELINLEKAIVTQMWALNLPLATYLRVTHTPHVLKGGRVARFFENPIMEFLSRNSWHVVLLWIPVAFYYASVAAEVYSPSAMAFLFAGGIFMWTLLEYSLHRFLYHVDGLLPDNSVLICIHFLMHGVHHFLPMDRLRLVTPPPIAFIILQPLYWSLRLFASHVTVCGLLSGGVAGYIMYDLTHYYLHHGVPFTQHLRMMKSYHLNHHYKNYHLGYGITSKFWDRVFGTLLEAK